jgi:putative nucleotidyltransferase with HDIG domain
MGTPQHTEPAAAPGDHGKSPSGRDALLIVDHDSVSRQAHKERIEAVCPQSLEVIAASTAEEALGILYSLRDQNRGIEMVIAKQNLSGIPGGRLLEIVNAQFPLVTKILLSDHPSLDEAVYSFNNAGLSKYIPLPWEPEDVKFTITALLRQREMKALNDRLLDDLQERNQQLTVAYQNLESARAELERSYIQTVQSLAVALEAKDRYTAGHSQRVSRVARLIARGMSLPKAEVDLVGQVALLHDIGKIGMLDTILNKPGKLTAEELDLVKSHPVVGAQILGPVRTFERHVLGIKHHHEMYDGSGYPDGLRGKEIPLAARVVSLADSFDAMTSTRPYRVGLPLEFAMKEMQRMSGKQFCPDVVEAFLRILRESGVMDARAVEALAADEAAPGMGGATAGSGGPGEAQEAAAEKAGGANRAA